MAGRATPVVSLTADLVRVRREAATEDSPPDAATVARLLDGGDDSASILELGVWWAGVHFLLSGEVPLPRQEAERRGIRWDVLSPENVLMGGAKTGYEDALGGARYLDPASVASIAPQLSALGLADLERRFDAEALTDEGIPPGSWTNSERQTLLAAAAALITFYEAAAAAGDGIVIHIA